MTFNPYPNTGFHRPPGETSATFRNPLLKTLLAIAIGVAATAIPAGAKPPPHNISAGNLEVIQNDTGNTVNSVTVTCPLSINDFRVRPGSNRGDYNFQIGDQFSDDSLGGVTMVSISQNGRDNGELAGEQKDYSAPAFDGSTNGMWASINNLQSDRGELNINCSVAYFRTNDWLCGWFRNTNAVNGGSNTLYTASPGIICANSSVTAVGSYNFKWVKNGEFRVSLFNKGYDSRTNPGVLLVNHAKNEGNYCSSRTNSDGTWEIFVKDNFANTNALEQDPCAFVFVPRSNTNIVSGKFGLDATGTNAVTLIYSGNAPAFTVSNIDVGRYRLTVPGGSPDAGVLVVSSESGNGVTGSTSMNFDNTVSYEKDGSGWIIEHRDCGQFPPLLEACTNEPVCSFVYIPAATPGVTVSPTNTLVTSEFGLTATFNVQLDLAPTNDVVINLSSSNPSEGIVSTNSLTFNATNWNIPQPVTVTGQDDALTDGNIAYSIILAPISSADLRYDGLNPDDVSVINVDDETYGITVTPTSGLTTTEAGGTAQFSVFLNRAPSADVTLGLSSDTVTEGLPTVSSLIFNSTNWNVPQIVTVTGVADFRKDGNKAYKIITAAATSADANYNGINPADVSLVNIDTDNPGINYSVPNPLTVIEGGTTNYSIVLATQPDTNVNINVTCDTTIATVSPAAIIFTPANWNTPQVVTVYGVDNLIADGNVSFIITNLVTVSSATVTNITATTTNIVTITDPLYADFNGAKTISAVRVDNETSVTLPSGDCLYGIGMPAEGIDGRASIANVNAITYNNGSITFTLTTNSTPDDVLAIRNDGTDTNQIGVAGTDVTYAGVVIGSFAGGTNGAALVVSLNANSTVAAAQQLIRATTFRTTTNSPSRSTRFVTVALNDGLGVNFTTGKAIRVGALRLMQFQEGADFGYGEYHGAADIALSQVDAGIPWPAGRNLAEGLLIDWPDGGTPNESQVLLRFDQFTGTNYWQVPSNAVVVSADLLVNVNNTGDGGKLYRMLIPWDATNDTWGSLGDGVQQDDVESRSIYDSQLGLEDGSGATGTGVITVGVTPDVQTWVNGTNNFGWVFKGWPLMTDGTGFSPSEAANVSLRPRLRVLWLDQGFSTASFRQGVDNYTNTADTNLRQATADVNYVADLTAFSDYHDAGGTNTTESLLRFDNIIGGGTNQIPPGSLIHAAVLELPSVGNSCMGNGGRFYEMLQPWSDTNVTWNTYGANGIQPDGMVAATTPSFAAGNSSLNPLVQGTMNTFEVTGDLQTWANGTHPNYGWAVLPWT
ncbi:MAG: DNRLRE domain-containing protein, partial [Verrucomicrobiota bacterium]